MSTITRRIAGRSGAAKIVCVGEAMVEFCATSDGWAVGFGGDSFNTAVHLARAGHDVSYMTALGRDLFSERLRAMCAAEKIDGSLILTHPSRQVGLYAISTDAAGERSFTYWRETSAARALFELSAVDAAMSVAETADLLYFSLISLSILPPQGREALLRLAARVRENGGLVAFDGNYRPALWETRQAAAGLRDAAIAHADIGLPTFEDEAAMGGVRSPHDVVAHWRRRGCAEVIVKLGADGCLLPDGTACPPAQALHPVDTSGAGDAFNGGYLAARMRGASLTDAAQAGHELAGWAVMQRGAIPARDAAAPYEQR